MKKIIALLFICTALAGQGQDTKIPEDLSIVAGPGMSYVFGGEKLYPSFGYLLGIEKNVLQFSEKSYMNMGIVLSMKGAEYREIIIEEDITQSGKVSLGYIGLPILFRHRSSGGFFWEAGLQTGFLLVGKDLPEGGEKSDYKDSVKALDISIPVGVGYWLHNRFSFGARAVYGLTDMSANGAKISPAETNHQNFLVIAMFRYNITGK